MTGTVTEDILKSRWTKLDASSESFKYDLGKYIWAEPSERKLFCFECENIDFQNEEGGRIWSTKGSGEILLPACVGVYIVRGKWKIE
ncbi:hypothetical protein ACJ73_01624 [Blastomyces percursus]|uniref:Uncharacterized protein n=1 Tax=Blastomyces percursus TaxID=1658174 RepID=A0A1J9QDS9_9EURO|nr:hypothetical protein ACJ73_01624 [Blastomyces percursus]